MSELEQLRGDIDAIDRQIVDLMKQRMETVAQVAEYKKANNIPVLDSGRERALLSKVGQEAGEELADYIQSMYRTIMAASRSYENGKLGRGSKVYDGIKKAMEETPQLFPQRPIVACQGIEGAYSQIACDRLFKVPSILYFQSFDHVFKAVESGMCQYGILPIENSTAGSVTKVYDLMIQHNFYIARTFRLKVDHNLLANPGAKLEDIQEIYSHEQAINQCSAFLHSLKGVNVVPVANTAVAAEMVAASGRKDVAALSSRSCMELYNLKNLAASVQDKGNNRTRFICISKNMEIYPGSDKTSIMMVLSHKPGALYKVLARIYSLGINVTKLESRPIPDREFEFMFYFDLETSIYSDQFAELMCELESLCEEFKYLGSYTEVV